MLLSDIRKEYSATVMRPVEPGIEALEARFAELERRAEAELRDEGATEGEQSLRRFLDVRYRGQSYELTVPGDRLEPAAVAAALRAAHEQRFGYAPESAPAEVVNLRLRAVGRTRKPCLPRAEAVEAPAPAIGTRRVFAGEWQDAALYNRESLRPGHFLHGPALLLQADTTTWVPRGCAARVGEWYNVVVRLEAP
ncbi:MAG TPA: hydantoinase/oxoprolinase family protein, partial [Armatimonadota bacterium]|nr:hydantoinase/oxoprolinase family protein [Armatimonadota bacterium]